MDWTTWLLGPLVGGGAGFVAGFFGVGGGFLLVPLIALLLPVPANVAVGSTACYTLGPATTGLLARKARGEDWRIPLIFLGGTCMGLLLGADVLEQAEADGPVDDLVLASYFIVLSVMGSFGVIEAVRGKPWPRGWINRVPIGPYVTLSGPKPKKPDETWTVRMSVPLLAAFGFFTGILSGITGMGGGLVILPGLMYLFGLPAYISSRLTLIAVWITCVAATCVHACHDNIDLLFTVSLLIGGTVGAKWGAEVGLKLEGARLRAIFGLMLLLTAIPLGLRLCGIL